MASDKGINATFAALGTVAAIALVATGGMWVNRTEAVATQDASPLVTSVPTDPDSQTHSGRSRAPEVTSDTTTTHPRSESPDSPTDRGCTSTDPAQVIIVKPGDTLSMISAETGVSVQNIAQANGITDVNLIYAGSALVIP